MSAQTYIDGVEVTDVVLNGSVTRRLNRPAQATCRVWMGDATGSVGDVLKIVIDGTLFFHGRILTKEGSGGEDTGYFEYTASDPLELWQWRPVRDDDCDFSKPSIITDYETGPQIVEAMMTNSIDCGAGPPSDAEGDLGLDFGTFETGGVSLLGAPVDWPMTMAELSTMLTSTGEVDIVVVPDDATPGILGILSAYNGDYGSDLSGSVSFQYATGARNVREVRLNQDMSQMVNKLWYYGGPRIGTAQDPKGDQHWCWNITGDDPDLYGNVNNPFGALSGGPFADHGPGGAIPTSASYDGGLLGDLAQDSRDAYWVRMQIFIWDALSDLCLGEGDTDPERWLYRFQWQNELLLRSQPRTLAHVIPVRNAGVLDFDIGDIITVEAGTIFGGGFSGAQRVYSYTITWDSDGVYAVTEIQSSEAAEAV